MSRNILRETVRRLQILQPKTHTNIRESEFPVVSFSEEMEQKVDSLRHFLYSKFYRQPEIVEQSERGMQIIKRIFFTLHDNPHKLPKDFQKLIEKGEKKEIVIKDFIAGMTDGFAIDFEQKL